VITKYTVSGMTCEHCERRVQAELFLLESVTSVTADSKTGIATVESDVALNIDAVAAAVEEAGYVLVTD
jgi:copper chaperone